MLPALYTLYPLYDFGLRATHARTLLPAALASVSFGFVLVRVRARLDCPLPNSLSYLQLLPFCLLPVRCAPGVVSSLG